MIQGNYVLLYGPLEVLKLLLVHSLGGMEFIGSQS